MITRYDLAPLDGITKAVFRRVHHAMFGGPGRYFIPFFSPTDQHILTQRDRRELDAANNGELPLVPQVMTRRAEDFLWAAEVLADLGYREVNLNLGCPSGTVTAKGKGSGFLAHPEELDHFFDQVFSSVKLPVSVKTRLGYETRRRNLPACWRSTTAIPSLVSPFTPESGRRSTGGPFTMTSFAGRWRRAAIRYATMEIC